MLRRLSPLLLLVGLLGLVAAAPATTSPADEAPPATIRVCRQDGSVDTVPFKEYVKAVLPVEFYPSWPTETLRAGASVIKSYAWYFINHPISDRCDLGDTTRYQLYAPEKQRRTAATNAAVEASWHVRMWDLDREQIAFAQYCSNGCRVHARNAGEGRYMDQQEAFELGRSGHSSLAMLEWFYRNLPVDVTSWTDGLALHPAVELINMDAPGSVGLAVDEVAPGDPRVQVRATAVCTVGGAPTALELQAVSTAQGADGATVASFDDLGRLASCEDQEAAVHFELVVNDHAAVTVAVPTWRPWRSATSRTVTRIGNHDDRVQAALATSAALFSSRAPASSSGGSLLELLTGGDDEPEPAGDDLAEVAVLVAEHAVADALAATALAGTRGPLLLHPDGSTGLDESVATELQRILAPAAVVHLVGGVASLPDQVARDIEELGFTALRTSGSDRITTSVAVAQRLLDENRGNGMVLLARAGPDDATGWADSVSAAPWAARTGTPILLTDSAALSPQVADWIRDPDHGVGEVLVIGGTSAVPDQVRADLAGVTVTRIAGTRRDATALAVADQLWGSRGTPAPAAAFAQNVFDETGWPFAVVGAVAAARSDAAAVAVWSMVPPSTTGAWLDARAGLPVLLVGGTGAVSAQVEASLAGT